MRIAVAGFMLESVSFLPNPVTLAEFQAIEATGEALLDRYRGTNTLCGGFLAVCEREGAEVLPILFLDAGAAGPATDAAFLHYADRICAALAEAGPLDGVLLAVHGALTTPTRLDPDREILERVRAVVGRDVPVCVGLDYHANLDASWLELADAIFGYHYSPHTDIAATGERAAECLMRMLREGFRPAMALRKPGVMVPSIFSATGMAPLSGIVAESVAMARDGQDYLDVTVFAGFSYADVPNCGFSVLAVAADPATAGEAAARLDGEIRRRKRDLLHGDLVLDIPTAVERAIALAADADRPVVLLEHADRCNDSTYLLRALLERKVRRAAVPYIWDAKAAAACLAAGAGAEVTLDVGGHSSERAGGPVRLTGRVAWVGEKAYRTTGAYMHGRLVQLGTAAVLDVDVFTQFGMRARDFGIIVLRSKTHFRAAYEPIAEAILIVDTPDWGPADLTTLPYRQVPRERVFPFSDLPG